MPSSLRAVPLPPVRRTGHSPRSDSRLRALADPHWSALTPVRPLALVAPGRNQGRAYARNEPPEHRRARAALPRRRELSRPAPAPAAASACIGRRRWPRAMRASPKPRYAALEERDGAMPVLQLLGDDGAGQRDVAAAIAAPPRPATASFSRGGHSREPARARCPGGALAPRGRPARQRAPDRLRRRRDRRGAASRSARAA